MNAPANIAPKGPVYHSDVIQGSDEWYAVRLGLLTASEMKLILTVEGGNTVTKYRATGTAPKRPTVLRMQALEVIGDREGTMREHAFAADVSEAVLRGLQKDGCLEAVKVEVPISFRAASDDKERLHLYELLAQRITRYVEPRYVSDDMVRGHDDEIEARIQYEKKYGAVDSVGFITNDKWGFTIGYSPDGLVGVEGLIEAKSRRQKFQVQTIIENVLDETIPTEYLLQPQTGLLVSERKWCDFISYSGGLPMATIRVWPDEVIMDAILNATGEFEHRLAQKLDAYNEAVRKYDRLIPTERKVEQEMYV